MKRVAVAALLLLGGSARANGQQVEPVLERFVSYWARGDESAIAGLATRQGISLELDRKEVGPLAERQAAALLRRLFEDHETLSVRLMTSRSIGGQPKRAFGEVTWMMRSRGTTIPDKASVFVALVLEDDQWRITEIRFIRP